MEKFAIDLDRVLDEFEFNEDCAEQVASSADSENLWTSLPIKPISEDSPNFVQSTARDVVPLIYRDQNNVPAKTLECEKLDAKVSNIDASRKNDTLHLRKVRPKRENSDSMNDFYNQGTRTVEDKVHQKECLSFGDGEPVSSTIYNDISHKLVQKQQNESVPVGTKSYNSYDKKLNQPNIKPSVSNVFSSLNDYINAPSGNTELSDNSAIQREVSTACAKTESLEAVRTIGKPDEIIIRKNFSATGIISRDKIVEDESVTSKSKESDRMKSLTGAEFEYQNFVLPAMFDSDVCSSKKPDMSEVKSFVGSTNSEAMTKGHSGISSDFEEITGDIAGANMDACFNSGTNGKQAGTFPVPQVRLPSASIKIGPNTEPDDSTSEGGSKRAYENFHVPLQIRDVENIHPTVISNTDDYLRSSERIESKNHYENLNLKEKSTDNDGKTAAYPRMYVDESKDSSNSGVEDTESPRVGDRATTSKFQNVNSNAVMKEKELAVGFSATIDDPSEDELNKYLAELEAEERMIEKQAMYENVGKTYDPLRDDGMPHRVIVTSGKTVVQDEDVNEAPIFETVTIGVLPTVSEEQLQEKAKKFPVIDYSKQRGSSSAIDPRSRDFLEKKGLEPIPAYATIIGEPTAGEESSEEGCSRNAKLHNEINIKKMEGQTSTENQENIEPGLSVANTMEEGFFMGEPIENISLNYDGSYMSVNNDSSKDFASKKIEFEGHNANNARVEFESNKVAEEPLINYGEPQNRPEMPKNNCESGSCERSDCSAFTEKNMNPNIGGDVDNSNDNDRVSEFRISSDDDSQESTKDKGCNPEDKPSRPQKLDIIPTASINDNTTTEGLLCVSLESHEQLEAEGDVPQQLGDYSQDVTDSCLLQSGTVLGKQPPFWIPDNEAPNCMLCDIKFTVIKRRHHCRACGKVLCNKCCGMKYRLEYQRNIDSRVCSPCYQLLVKVEQEHESGDYSSTCANISPSNIISSQGRQPNPNNPMEYCSTIPPLQQLAGGLPPTPTVMVPIGVLKREGSSKQRHEGQKSVMFSDGIRPGCDLTELDASWDLKPPYRKIGKRTVTPGQILTLLPTKRQNIPLMDPITNCYIPQDPDILPPTVMIHKGEISYHETIDAAALYKSLSNECEPPIMFAINRNLYAYVKITNLNCCVNRICWNVTSRGLACVGQDEIILLVEALPDETQVPKDLLIHINQIYIEAIKGNTITELGVSIHQGGHFLGSREHTGFLFIRQTFQCLQKMILPPAPFLVGLLVHRWETPWAKVFPLRLMLRLGAEYRYYPCPLVSIRFRDAVYFEIGHTIMKVLADFRNFGYTLPGVRGLLIHMQDRTTDILFPKNRYDQVIKGLNNSNDHVLAFASNFSIQSDSHLVCIQTNTGDESSYQTQAINIHNKPRRVTGASFVVINGALKSSMGLSAKSSIVEDGLMLQIMPEKMEALKASLKNMHDFSIGCGLQGSSEPDETVNIKWVDNDVQFNLGVKSPIDGRPMDGIPSIRVHNGTDYVGTSRFIRWTEVFIIKSDDHPAGVHDPVDINKMSESIARATCAAFVKLLDLLATAGLTKLAVRTTIHPDNVGYEAGSEGSRLPPIYMNSLDNELIQVLHKAAQLTQDADTVLELIFHVLDD